MKKIVSIILSLLLVFLFAFSSICVMAQETEAIDIAQLQEKKERAQEHNRLQNLPIPLLHQLPHNK